MRERNGANPRATCNPADGSTAWLMRWIYRDSASCRFTPQRQRPQAKKDVSGVWRSNQLIRYPDFFDAPRLGIDEVKIIGKYRCILTNVEKNTAYDLLVSPIMAHLRTYFRQFPHRKDVELFSTDLWNNYATVAKEFFPEAIVVADRFHIQRMGTNGMEAARKAIRKGLPGSRRL